MKIINESQISITSKNEIKKRRNNTIIYSAYINDEMVILKVGEQENIMREFEQKNVLSHRGYKLAKTLYLLKMANSKMTLVEEFISDTSMIDLLIETQDEESYINDGTFELTIKHFSSFKYDFVEYEECHNPFNDVHLLNEQENLGPKVFDLFTNLSKKLNIKNNLVVSHGDFTAFNVSKNFSLIDFEDVAYYPIGFDIISFYYSDLWFPDKSLGIDGPFNLYKKTEDQKKQTAIFINNFLNKYNINSELSVEQYIEGIILLRGIWHLIGCNESQDFLNWRANKILTYAKEANIL